MNDWWEKVAEACESNHKLEDECEQEMMLVSMRPQPGTSHGDAWEAGFRYAWDLRNRLTK